MKTLSEEQSELKAEFAANICKGVYGERCSHKDCITDFQVMLISELQKWTLEKASKPQKFIKGIWDEYHDRLASKHSDNGATKYAALLAEKEKEDNQWKESHDICASRLDDANSIIRDKDAEIKELKAQARRDFDRINELEDIIVENGLDETQNP